VTDRTLTPEEVARLRAGGRRIAPGIWVDAAGDLHFSVPELLALFGWPDTPADRAELETVIREILAEQYPGVPVIHQEEG
jgi:hypothetical protein